MTEQSKMTEFSFPQSNWQATNALWQGQAVDLLRKLKAEEPVLWIIALAISY
jgi:hypothetical protein